MYPTIPANKATITMGGPACLIFVIVETLRRRAVELQKVPILTGHRIVVCPALGLSARATETHFCTYATMRRNALPLPQTGTL